MEIMEIRNCAEVFFVDLETVNDSDIVQIGITKWCAKKRILKIVFDKVVNPKVAQEDINRFAEAKHFISEYQWSKAKTIKDYEKELKSTLNGSIIFHWGGDDAKLLQASFESFGLDTLSIKSFNLLHSYFNSERLESCAQKHNIYSSAFHDAAFDSYVSGLLFAINHFNYVLGEQDHLLLDEYDRKYKHYHGRFNVTEIQQGSGAAGELCLTGFKKGEKVELSNVLTSIGYKVRGDVTKKLDYLITPSGEYKRSPSKEKKARDASIVIISLDKFLKEKGIKVA